MNERLITHLLTAYRACSADADQLRRQRIVLADALEEAGDARTEVARDWKIIPSPYGNGNRRVVFGAGQHHAFKDEQSAELEIRRYILALFQEMKWQEIPVKSVSLPAPLAIGKGARLFIKR